METIKVEFMVDEKLLLNAFKGCNWESDPVAGSFIFDGEYTKNGINLSYQTPDANEATAELTTTDLARGLSMAISAGANHCGEDITVDFDEWDACVGTAILQFALFGEEVFG